MQQHTWHEPAQYHAMLALTPTDSTTVLDLSAVHSHLLLCVVNDAMATHLKSLRVQNAALSLLDSVFQYTIPSVLTSQHSSAVAAVTRALVTFASRTAAIHIAKNIFSTMLLMLEQHERFQQEFLQIRAIELVVNYMKKSDCL